MTMLSSTLAPVMIAPLPRITMARASPSVSANRPAAASERSSAALSHSGGLGAK